jgi:hypothetical protein
MALTDFQRDICRLLAAERRARGESSVAGGVALSVAIETRRLSRGLDLFHDTTQAVAASWDADRRLLNAAGYDVAPIRERPGFVQATIARDADSLLVEWVRDSAFRFFPLVEHPDLGLTLHPFDLATNKVLALIGRAEVRDWVDVLACDERLQPLGYLVWAACGKDPGFSPRSILDRARRSTHYSAEEVATLAFQGPPPDAAGLALQWQAAIESAAEVVGRLPASHAGKVVLTDAGDLFRGDADALGPTLTSGRIHFHAGRIGGALPKFAL